MTPNTSLYKSCQIREYLRNDHLKVLSSVFPFDVIDNFDNKGTRDRVYSTENTILTMVYTSTLQDKTLENSVDIFKKIHDSHKEIIIENVMLSIEKEKAEDLQNPKIRRGPKKKYKFKIPKSKTIEISNNTAAYSNARKRVNYDLLKDILAHMNFLGIKQKVCEV